MKNIPSLPQSAFLQQLRWIQNPVNFMMKTNQYAPDLCRVNIAGEPLVFVSHPEALQTLLTSDRQQFSAPGELNSLLTPLVGNFSLVSLDGDRHKQERKLLAPVFHGERMQHYAALITQLTETLINEIPIGEPFKAQDLAQSITLRVIIEAVFGIESGDRYLDIIRLIRKLLNSLSSPFVASILFFDSLQKDWGPWSPWGYFVRLRQELDDVIFAEIRERRQQDTSDRQDILSLLLATTDDQGKPLSDQELRDELMLLLLAGHDTTAIMMSWGLYWIHATAGVLEKLQAELQSLGENPSPLDLVKLPYLTAVCNETLRIRPVAMLTFSRRVETATELLGYALKPKDVVIACIYLLHQRPDLYPNPDQFQPERFLEKQFSPYEFMPFGNGARRCVGDALAQFELKLAIATLIRKHQFKLLEKTPVKPRRRGVVLASATGIRLQRES